MPTLYTNDQFEEVADYFEQQYFMAYEEILKKIGRRIGEIGKLTPSDAHRLNQMAAYGADANVIQAILERESKKSKKELKRIFEGIANNGYQFAEQFYQAKGVPQPPIKKNDRVQQIIAGIWRATKGAFDDFSGTSAVGVLNRLGRFVPLQEYYLQLIDNAVYQVTTGVSGYESAMRQAMKELLRSGIRVKYASGATRELYSAVRMNVLDGCNQVMIETQQECGRQYGADGVEISAHGLCAPDHVHIQGRQFSKAEYERLNGSLERPIGHLNCRHFAFPIVMGISSPAYSKDQLKELENLSNGVIRAQGRLYTRYNASQRMRRYEHTLREKNASRGLLAAMGDTQGAEVAQKRIRELSAEYRKFCKEAGLTPRPKRTRPPKL